MTKSDYEWLQATTSDYNLLRARLRVTTSDYEWLQGTWLRARLRVTMSDYRSLQVTTSQSTSDYKWLQMTASNYQSSYEWLQLGLAISLGIKTFIVSFDYITMNEVNTLIIVLKIVLLRIWWNSLKNTRDAEVVGRCSSK